MKGFKALRALPFEKTVTFTATKKNTNSLYECRMDNFAYTAQIVDTKNGEVLIVCLYGTSKTKGKRVLKAPLIERHFLSETGEIASERFDEDFSPTVGNFTVSTSTMTWDYYSFRHGLVTDRYCNYFEPINNADDVILGFAERHRLYERVRKQTIPGAKYTSGLCWLAAHQTMIKNEKTQLAAERLKSRTIDRMDTVPKVSSGFEQWVLNEQFSTAAWFYKYEGREAHGICGGCKERSVIPKVKNGAEGYCPKCGRPVRYISVKNMCKCFKHVYNANYIEMISENNFICRYFTITKYYYSDMNDNLSLKVDAQEFSRRFFCVKNVSFKETGFYKAMFGYSGELLRWDRIPPKYGVYNPGKMFTGNVLEITDEIAESGICALKNADLRELFKCCSGYDPLRVILTSVRMPALESMAKMGLRSLATDIISYGNDARELLTDIGAGSPAKMLGITKPLLKKFAEIDISYNSFRFWREARVTENDFAEFAEFIENYKYQLNAIGNIFKEWQCVKFLTMSRYLDKQREKLDLDAARVVEFWQDYLRMIRRSDVEKNRALLYPQNVRAEHDRMTALYKYIKTIDSEKRLSWRAELLDELSFSNDDLIIVPLRSADDFFNESNVLNHCVKTYLERCADGKTNIFGLRKTASPDVPYFTVNIDNNGELIQNRGKNNCDPPKAVKQFVEKWLKYVEKKLKKISLDPSSVLDKINVKIGA